MVSEAIKPDFSILILSWRSEQHLPRCLRALEAQRFKKFEVLLLDNGNESPLSEDLLTTFPDLTLKILRSEKNLGFAAGNNLLAKEARGDYIVLLNADAFPEADWLSVLHAAAIDKPNHFFASRLIKANEPDKLDGEWHVYHASGLAWRHMHNQPLSQATNAPKEVFGACAAASAIHARLLNLLAASMKTFLPTWKILTSIFGFSFRVMLAYTCHKRLCIMSVRRAARHAVSSQCITVIAICHGSLSRICPERFSGFCYLAISWSIWLIFFSRHLWGKVRSC